MKRIELKHGQVWRPRQGKWRTIYATGANSGEIHYFMGAPGRKNCYWTTPEGFRKWIGESVAKLVGEEAK